MTLTGEILKRNKDLYLFCEERLKENPELDEVTLQHLIYQRYGRELLKKSFEVMVVAQTAIGNHVSDK